MKRRYLSTSITTAPTILMDCIFIVTVRTSIYLFTSLR